MKVKFIKETRSFDEYFDEGPTKAVIELDINKIEEILRYNKIVKKEKVDSITKFDYTPEYMRENDEEELTNDLECGIECEIMHVTDNSVYWSFMIKHTNINGETDSISIETLKEILKIQKTKKDILPTLINDLISEEAKNFLKEKLNEKTGTDD